MKHCARCGHDKPLSDFGIDRSRPDGRRIYCQACTREMKRKYDLAKKPAPVQLAMPLTRICSICKQEKPLTAFKRGVAYQYGYRPQCLACYQDKYREADRGRLSRKNRNETPESRRRRRVRHMYRISTEDYQRLFQDQEGLCWICQRPSERRRLLIDHDHSTGAVRGLLCPSCNTGLGYFRDDPARLARAIDYLSRSRSASL